MPNNTRAQAFSFHLDLTFVVIHLSKFDQTKPPFGNHEIFFRDGPIAILGQDYSQMIKSAITGHATKKFLKGWLCMHLL